MNNNIKETDYDANLGVVLHNARLKKGKTVAEIAKVLCLKKSHIEAIENNEYSELPPAPYNYGFVRSLAEYLDLDADKIVQMYKDVISPSLKSNNADVLSELVNDTRDSNSPKITHIIIGFVGILLLFIVWKFVFYNKQISTPVTEETSTSEYIPEPVIIEDSSDQVINQKNDNMVASSTEQIEDGANNTSDNIASIDNENTNQENTLSTKLDTEKKLEEATQSNNTKNESLDDNSFQLKVVFEGPSWIEIKRGDNIVLTGEYGKGFSFETRGLPNTVVSVGRYNNVAFYINGKLTKVASAMRQMNINLDEFLQKKE